MTAPTTEPIEFYGGREVNPALCIAEMHQIETHHRRFYLDPVEGKRIFVATRCGDEAGISIFNLRRIVVAVRRLPDNLCEGCGKLHKSFRITLNDSKEWDVDTECEPAA